MKRLKNIALFLVIFSTLLVVGGCLVFKYQIGPINSSESVVEVTIPAGATVKNIAEILNENNLIRNESFFLIYVKLMNTGSMKAGIYELSPSMGVEEIIDTLIGGTHKYEGEINVTFKEGLTMRQIATVISENTNNTYDEVIDKSNDETYINSLIRKYWFITEDVLNDDLYYKLEGYLYPETYRFSSKDASVEDIFNIMIEEMEDKLSLYKDTITNSNLSIHEILTLASVVEKEASTVKDRPIVASVFMNRMNIGMALGSDVTTRYAVKLDDAGQTLTAAQYAYQSKYNTRLTDGSMNGKLPVGPICNLSVESIGAAVNPNKTDYIYFMANIQTLETFYYNNYNDFLVKKNELASINNGY